MIRTGQQYRDSIRDGRQVWINGERVRDVSTHPMFRPLIDFRAQTYDMQHEAQHAPVMSYREAGGEVCPVAAKLPMTQERLVRQTPRDGRPAGRGWRRGHSHRQRNRRRDVVSVRRPGHAE
jgi:aromatic ring hydroxylase